MASIATPVESLEYGVNFILPTSGVEVVNGLSSSALVKTISTCPGKKDIRNLRTSFSVPLYLSHLIFSVSL